MSGLSRYNGDGHLRADQRLAYLVLNFLNNRSPYRGVDRDVTIADFQGDAPVRHVKDLPGVPSPSRALSDLFWMHLPWEAMERELGSLRFFDLGCGSGSYALNFMRWSGGRLARYTGLDRQEHARWTELSAAHASVDFVVGDIERLTPHIPMDANVVVSQSAIEHVRDDGACFDALHAFTARIERPLLQIHLVPSAACLALYLWHGYRQYTPRTLSTLTRQFSGSQRLIVRLGGDACNRLHWTFITWPLLIRRTGDRRESKSSEYRRLLEEAIAADVRQPQTSPSFYAMLIFTNARAQRLDAPCWLPAP